MAVGRTKCNEALVDVCAGSWWCGTLCGYMQSALLLRTNYSDVYAHYQKFSFPIFSCFRRSVSEDKLGWSAVWTALICRPELLSFIWPMLGFFPHLQPIPRVLLWSLANTRVLLGSLANAMNKSGTGFIKRCIPILDIGSSHERLKYIRSPFFPLGWILL